MLLILLFFYSCVYSASWAQLVQELLPALKNKPPARPLVSQVNQLITAAAEHLPNLALEEIFFRHVLQPNIISASNIFDMMAHNQYLAKKFVLMNNPQMNVYWEDIMLKALSSHSKLFQMMLESENAGRISIISSK